MQSKKSIIQRDVTVGEQKYQSYSQELENSLKSSNFYQQNVGSNSELEAQVLALLRKWVTAEASYGRVTAYFNRDESISQDNRYQTFDELARGLIGEISSEVDRQAQNTKATEIAASAQNANSIIMLHIDSVINKIKQNTCGDFFELAYDAQGTADLSKEEPTNIRYGDFYKAHGKKSKKRRRDQFADSYSHIDSYETVPQFIVERKLGKWNKRKGMNYGISLLLDTAYVTNAYIEKYIVRRKRKSADVLSSDQQNARGTSWNPNESSEWAQAAREEGKYLQSGPSASIGLLMRLCRYINASAEEMDSLGKAAFAFWNKDMYKHKSGTHTEYEVTDVVVYHKTLM